MGAIPGTLAAHPLDLTKIRLQLGAAVSVRHALSETLRHGPWAGVGPGMQQKVLTRGPMFLASELATQTVESIGVERQRALWIGSFCSGYVTGCVAALSECAKVQSRTQPCRVRDLVRKRLAAGDRQSVWRLMQAAALRNAVFDAIFFGVQHGLAEDLGWSSSISYATAAAVALTLDYPLDVMVKRHMAGTGPIGKGAVASTMALLMDHGWRKLYRGWSVKVLEFATSYCVTGAVAPIVARGLTLLLVSSGWSTSKGGA